MPRKPYRVRGEVINDGCVPVLHLLCAHGVHRVAGQVRLGPLARSQELLLLVGKLVELLVGISGRAAEVVLAWSGSGLGLGLGLGFGSVVSGKGWGQG